MNAILVGLVLAAALLVGGTVINLRSVRAGRGPSRVGLRMQAASLALVVIGAGATAAILLMQRQMWLGLILVLPVLLVGAVLAKGALMGPR